MKSAVIWQGSVPTEAIAVVLDSTSNRLIEPAVEAMIDAEWQRQLVDAMSRGMSYFDSEAYRVNSVAASETGIELHLASSPYRIHATMKILHGDSRVTAAHLDRHLIVDAILRTADDTIVVQNVSKVVEEETYLIGGSCSKSRIAIINAADLAVYLLDRVDSVTGLQADEREIADVCGIVDNEIGCRHLIYTVLTSLDSNQIQRRFETHATTQSLTFVPVTEWASWTKKASGYVQVLGGLVP